MLSSLDNLLLKNMDLLPKMAIFQRPAARFLLSRKPLGISDLRFKSRYSNSYALISEKNSPPFIKVMRRLERYIGAVPIGPNKYWEYPWVLANLMLEKNMSVLDAGCGKSPVQFLLYDLGCKVCGIDPFDNVAWHGIDRGLAKRFGCRIEYRKEGMESISFDDGSFDRVCCVSVIEHCRVKEVADEKMVPQTEEDRALQKRMMEELIRVLKPGGILAVTVDFNIPREDCLPESNVDIANLISVDGAEIYGRRCPELFPGEEGFDFKQLIFNSDVDITNYCDTLQTSIGLTLRKIK
jgi:SAM-dependent methyltransferase